uniref:7TM_GPCR_Srx domain-containing protein n=1 Tax=Toxocara canis TaxID=6265 RepID=A0A183U7E4_TOXCA
LRTIINAGTYKPVQHNAIDCFANPLVLFDQFTFTALPVMLMMNSIDRLLVLVAPLNYYTSTKMYIVVQVSAAYAFIFFVLCVTVTRGVLRGLLRYLMNLMNFSAKMANHKIRPKN